MKAIIMAGGEGARLRPLTSSLPKPMVPIVNKPVMEHIIELLKGFGINDIGVTTYYLPNYILSYFENGEKYGVNLHYFTEESPLGTGGSVLNAGDFLDDTFIVISGDAITNINLKDALEYHMQKKSKATLILKKEPIPLEYGIVITDSEGKIIRFLEKPNWGEVFSDNINTGIYILEPEIFNYYKKGDNFDFSKDLFPKLLIDNIPMYGYVTNGYWNDIGDFMSYKQTQFDILYNQIDINKAAKQISPGVWIDSGTFIPKDVIINPPVYIGKNCEIKKGVILDSYSLIGDYCKIDENTSIKKSIIWDNVHIGKNVQCRGTIICSKAVIKNNVNLYEGSIVGINCILHPGVTVKPDIKIWPHKNIKEDSIVSRNLIWGSGPSRILFGSNGINGEINVEITPEFASTLGSAFAAVIKNMGPIFVSTDGINQSDYIKDSIICGILSTGIDVISAENIITPISRFGVRFYKACGGIQIRSDSSDKNIVHLEFFNKNGGNISRNIEKKIEHLFLRGDFERCSANKIGKITKIDNFSLYYIHSNIGILKNIPEIKRNGIRILLGSKSTKVLDLTSNYLEGIGCDVEYCSSEIFSKPINEYISYFSNVTVNKKLDLGIIINDAGENILLIDENGNVIRDEKYTLLSSLIALKIGNTRKLIVPFTLTSNIEKMAQDNNAEVVRTKSSISDVMNEMLSNINVEKNDLIQYILNFDGILASGIIIDFLVGKSMSLGSLCMELPDVHVKKSEIKCDFQARGYVIRKLIEENQNDRMELFEGVKINSDNGWTIILPDNERPVFNIYTEGFSEEYAEELASSANTIIQNLMNKSSNYIHQNERS